MADTFVDQDPQETQDWLESLEGVIEHEGGDKATYLLNELNNQARNKGIRPPDTTITPYANTISPENAEKIPGDSLTAMNVAAYVRWNAMAMVAKANKSPDGLGGHIASFASSAALYEVGFNWFFKGYDAPQGPDLIFFQGHSAPGMYSRAYVEGRLDDKHLLNFRREVDGEGLSSYPHPFLMPDFWQFPTVSMGLGPLMAIYQARFMKYMEARGHAEIGNRKVWAFMGDGESDEPESRGALSLAAREKLDNLIFVVNCNLQRLDGPVRGNGRIIDELEGAFNGAGWNVIKVIWGSEWDKLMKRDTEGVLLHKFSQMVDGEFQDLRSKDPAHLRKAFFESNPEIAELVKDMSDSDLWQMTRGGHDPRKIYAAFAKAMKSEGVPTVILVKTIKGYGMGKAGEASMGTHSQKKMDVESLAGFRDKFGIPIKDEDLEKLPFIRPSEDSDEMQFIRRQRKKLGGSIPARRFDPPALSIPPISDKLFKSAIESSGDREVSTTNAFVRLLSAIARDKELGQYIVPIVPDEARTFGMEGMFRQMGIYAPSGQLYKPQDAESMMWYKESEKGLILEEGITEAGAFSSWLAAGTAGSNYGIPMIPFYIYYSMFGFQRIGDLAWAAGDIQARGFLMGATAGRTTLNGEGLQHQDGHGLLLAATYPTCRAYDPAFAYEMAVIVRDGLEKMYAQRRNLFYYITVMNENYAQPKLPDGAEEGIIRGIYLYQKAGRGKGPKVQLMGSGTIFREVIAAAEILKKDWKVEADVWSVPGVNQLHRDGMECERDNLIHPENEPKKPYLTSVLEGYEGPAVFSSDYMRAYPEQIRRLIPNSLTVLGTDGYGRSDSRSKLRDFFEVDRKWIVLASLKALAVQGDMDPKVIKDAILKYEIDPSKPNPLTD
ncbi:MAG: pyruvate dehydrogenase (acetyl-transferring), homodimeric type [Spirochaetaceae bacterium]|nr:pyruvate dehydrogenase (acetyl-transferring), homodimeric type [Spirochaetaceae bacterium]